MSFLFSMSYLLLVFNSTHTLKIHKINYCNRYINNAIASIKCLEKGVYKICSFDKLNHQNPYQRNIYEHTGKKENNQKDARKFLSIFFNLLKLI